LPSEVNSEASSNSGDLRASEEVSALPYEFKVAREDVTISKIENVDEDLIEYLKRDAPLHGV
jgi:hypothetical protein